MADAFLIDAVLFVSREIAVANGESVVEVAAMARAARKRTFMVVDVDFLDVGDVFQE